MAAGSNTWARRMKEKHKLTLAQYAVLDHIGFRDAHALLSDSGIARDLGEHRNTIRRITRRLFDLGIIERRGNAWIPREMVEIVNEGVAHSVPVCADEGVAHSVPPPGTQRARKVAHSVPPREKRNIEKRGRDPRRAESPPPVDALTPFLADQVRRGETVCIDGALLVKGTEAHDELRRALR